MSVRVTASRNLMITIKQIEAIYWIGRLGSFDAAARQLGTSQSAITRRIHDLETATQATLFDRTTRTPSLNEKGLSAYRQATAILDMAGEMVDSLADRDVVEKSVTIGVTEISALSWLPDFIASLAKLSPRLSLRVRVGGAEHMRDLLVGKEIDLAVVPDILCPPDFAATPLTELTASFCCARGRLPEGASVSPEILKDLPFIVQENVLFSQLIWRELAGNGTVRAPLVVTDGLLGLMAQIAAGTGLSLLPDFLLDAAPFCNAFDRLHSEITLPALPYVAICAANGQSMMLVALIERLRSACRFEKIIGAASVQSARNI